MATRDEWLRQPLEARLARLRVTADELGRAIERAPDAALSRRPAPQSWAAKEVVCHLRDIEELVILRFHTMLVMADPHVLVVGAPPVNLADWGVGGDVPLPLDADCWATERQYLTNDTVLALEAFRRRTHEILSFLARLRPKQWDRGSIHPHFGRVTFRDWTGGMAAHDENHLAQLDRALRGLA